VTDVGAALAAIHARLLQRGETVGTVESLTGGLLAAALTTTPGASATFRGGLVTYATDLKATLAGVSPDMLGMNGPVSNVTAGAMAAGARNALGVDWCLSTTGVAGPDSQDGVPVGTVYVGLADPAGDIAVSALRLTGDRNTIRTASVEQAVLLLGRALGSDNTTPG